MRKKEHTSCDKDSVLAWTDQSKYKTIIRDRTVTIIKLLWKRHVATVVNIMKVKRYDTEIIRIITIKYPKTKSKEPMWKESIRSLSK